MKMTLSGTAWKGDNDAPLYYYKNADYIAYYPYTANLAVTTVNEIVKYFTSKISATGQTSLADYRNADLMTAEVKAADVVRGQSITFSFAHKMAMLEVKAPVRSYTTSTTYGDAESAKAFTYKAPLGLKVDLKETDGGKTTLSLCNVGTETDANSGKTKDIFRCILVPSETAKTIEGQFQDGSVEVYFPAVSQEVKYTPAAGTYQGINIDYDYTNYNIVYSMPIFQEVFFNMMLIPALSQALTQCFNQVKNGVDIDDILLNYQWFSSIKKQYQRLKGEELTNEIIKGINQPISFAQEILGKPMKVALEKLIESTKKIVEED